MWWSWSAFITSGSDNNSCILASSSGEGVKDTGPCCVGVLCSVNPIFLGAVDIYEDSILNLTGQISEEKNARANQ